VDHVAKTNQDAYVVIKNFFNLENNWFFGVFDGHGTDGHIISHYVKKTLPELIMSKFLKQVKQQKSQVHVTFASAAISQKEDEIESENKTPRYDGNEHENHSSTFANYSMGTDFKYNF
jgi:serine/threonine protein phosphatase PrpC